MADCLKLIEDLSGGRLSDDELEQILEELQGVRESRAVQDGLESVETAVLQRGKVIAEEIELAALIEKRNRYKNILVEKNLMALADRANSMRSDPALGIEAALVGVNAPFEGASRSVDSLHQGLQNEYMGGMIADLRKADLYTQFNNMKGDLERDVARVIWALNTPGADLPRVGREATEIARIMNKYKRASLDRLNSEGGYVRQKSGHIVRQSNMPERMATAGRKAWKDTTRDLLDFEKMDIAPDKIEDFLDSAYQAIITGVRLNRDVNDIQHAFKGPGNIAKKDAASRVFEFKSPEDWIEYNRQFGSGSLRVSFMRDIDHNARNTALMINFGTNPEAMLDRVTKLLQNKYRDADLGERQYKRLLNTKWLKNRMSEVTGDVNFSANHKVSNIGAGVRAWKNMTSLGSAILSVPSDLGAMSSARIYHGKSILDAWGESFQSLFKGLSKGEQRQRADYIGIGIEGQLGEFYSRFNPQDTLNGNMARAMTLFFKLNLLTPWTDAQKRGITLIISHDLALNAGKIFDDLSPEMQRLLRIYDIDARKWEIARQAVQTGEDGKVYLMPGDVDDVRGSMFTGLSEYQQQRQREEIKSNLFALFASEASFAVPEPGARERAIMKQGYQPGTPAGEVIRFMGQFKSFSVAMLSKILGRQIYGYEGTVRMRDVLSRGAGANMGLINLIIGTTVLGYFSMQAHEIKKGRKPRPATADTFIAAMLQGGGLGIYGDFLFGEANRFGGGTLGTLAGPGIGTAAEMIDLLQRTRGVVTGGKEDLRGDVLRLTKNNIPFANLLYVRGALDYLLWYQLQESINPGYLRRMERRVKRENDQEYWLPPSSVIQTGGGFR